MSNVKYCEIISNEKLNPSVYSLLLEAGELADTVWPGQFVHVNCGQARILNRPLSVAGAEKGRLRLVYEVKGQGTAWLAERRSGERVKLLGPLGRGFSKPEGKALLVGGGMGAAPLLFYAERFGGCDAALGFRSKEQLILKKDYDGFCNEVYISSDDGSCGEHCYVDALVERRLTQGDYSAVRACGPKPMLAAIARLCSRLKLPLEVSLEERMGCGVGACLVCACELEGQGKRLYGHVCKDGPVFDAAEVVFDD